MATRRGKGEGCLTLMGDGRWRARVQVGIEMIPQDDGTMKKKYKYKEWKSKTKSEVIEKVREYEDEKKKHPNDKANYLIRSAFPNWLNSIKKIELKPQSFDRLKVIVNKYVINRIGKYTVGEVTSEMVQSLIITPAYEDGKSLSTIKKIKSALRDFYNYEVDQRIVTYNPIVAVRLPKKHNFTRKEINPYTEEEIEKMRALAERKDSKGNYTNIYGYVFLLILYTGLREGECLALEKTDWDKENKTLTINKNIGEAKNDKTGIIEVIKQDSPKSDYSNRTLPLNKQATECLEKIEEILADRDSKYMIPNSTTGDVLKPANFRNSFRRFENSAGVEHRGLHTLRHTFATTLFRNKVDIKYISEWLGHGSVNITYDTYIHIIKEMEDENKVVIPDF